MFRSSLILAGGSARRLGNIEKALVIIDGHTILERTSSMLSTVSDEVIISLRDQSQATTFGMDPGREKLVFDTVRDVGPLAGILEGCRMAESDYLFVTACDMPYLSPDVVELMFSRAMGHDAAIPSRDDGSMEPLCSVYKVSVMLPLIEKCVAKGERFILAPVFCMDDVVKVPVNDLREVDPELSSFVNINTHQDLEKFRKN